MIPILSNAGNKKLEHVEQVDKEQLNIFQHRVRSLCLYIKNHFPHGCQLLREADCEGNCPVHEKTENDIPLEIKMVVCQTLSDLAGSTQD